MSLGIGWALAGLGQGLEQGVGNYLSQKKLEHELALQERSADDAHTAALLEQFNMGLRPGQVGTGTSLPSSGQAPGNAPVGVGSLLGRAASGPAAGTPQFGADSIFGAQQGLPSVGASVAQQGPAHVVSPISTPQAQAGVQLDPDHYIDTQNSMYALKRNLLLAQVEGQEARAKHTQHEDLAPVLGEDGYADAQGEIAGARARAALPIKEKLKASPSGARIGGGTSGSPTSAIVHEGTMVNNQLRDTNASISADQKVLSNGLYQHSTHADSANYNAAAAEIPRLKVTRDSLRTVYGGLASKMQGTTQAPVQTKPTITKAEFQALRAKGHADADILGHYTVSEH